MAMIRNLFGRITAATSMRLWKRTFYSNWHDKDMNTKSGHDYQNYLRDLWHRRTLIGRDELKPRSISGFLWNYDAELFAFGKRLGEDFQMSTLRRAFRHSSYKPETTEEENEQQEETESAASSNNEELIAKGEQVLTIYVPAYLRYHFLKLPEEGIRTISAYLCSQKQLAYLAKHLGMFDLTLASDFPYDEPTMSDTFKAIIGALMLDSGEQKAEYFVQDFVLTELIDLDINEIFYVKNPMNILASILAKSGKAAPESRIIRQSGSFTVTPVYVIGIYVGDQLIGQAPGESTQIAEEMAARDCLKTLWNTHLERRQPLTFGAKAGRALNLAPYKDRENESLKSIIGHLDDQDSLGNALEDEPLNVEEMHQTYKTKIEPALGKVYRRRFKHTFYHGTLMRRCRRPFIQPSVKTI